MPLVPVASVALPGGKVSDLQHDHRLHLLARVADNIFARSWNSGRSLQQLLKVWRQKHLHMGHLSSQNWCAPMDFMAHKRGLQHSSARNIADAVKSALLWCRYFLGVRFLQKASRSVLLPRLQPPYTTQQQVCRLSFSCHVFASPPHKLLGSPRALLGDGGPAWLRVED